MITAVLALVAVGILLDLVFVGQMFPPWRSEDPVLAWILSLLALGYASFETVVLLSTFDVRIPIGVGMLIVAGKDGVLVMRMVQVRRSRRTARVEQEAGDGR